MIHAPGPEEVLGFRGGKLTPSVGRNFLRHAFVGEEEAEGGDEAFRPAVGGARLRSGDVGPTG